MTRWFLYLDDERWPPDLGCIDSIWKIARNYHDAVGMIKRWGIPTYMSLDHDLGSGLTGMDFVKWFCDYVMDNSQLLKIPDGFTWDVHSQNPVGKENMVSYLQQFFDEDYIP